MGGCRCSYRSCKARSDGKTHMFHFPVFDKVRCHRWITNAHKPNFLNLKLSQLKNRVICQHHFKDDSFMNFMRDKLKNTAVPTENGPYCEFSEPVTHLEDTDKPVIAINTDDIENDNTLNYIEKKAHSQVKYGDFLINDVTELLLSGGNSNGDFKLNHSEKVVYPIQKPAEQSRVFEDYTKYTINYENDEFAELNPLFKSNSKATIVSIEYDDDSTSKPQTTQTHTPNDAVTKSLENMNSNPTAVNPSRRSKPINPDKVVKILSEKTISEPVKVEGKLEPISPSMIIKRPKWLIEKNERSDVDANPQLTAEASFPSLDLQAFNTNVQFPPPAHLTIYDNIPVEHRGQHFQPNIYEHNIPIEFRSQDLQVNNIDGGNNQNQLENPNIEPQRTLQFIDPNNTDIQNKLNNVEKQSTTMVEDILQCLQPNAGKDIMEVRKEIKETIEPRNKPNAVSSPSKSIIRTKMPPGKLAAIEEKRKFNMKLRDVITSCLNNLEEQNEVIEKNISPDKRPKARVTRSQDSVVTYLESRLQRMENVLLSKIDHNNQRINELKRVIKPLSGVKNASTQTYKHLDDHTQKQQLYREISKYLSSDAKSMIFEELFMNLSKNTFKNDTDSSSSSPRKKRRR